MGHEIIGVVEEIGENVKKWKVGDRVTYNGSISCGQCPSCKRGDVNVCYDEFRELGIYKDGGFAEFVAIPTVNLLKVPDSVPDKHSTIFEQLATSIQAIRTSGFEMGDTAVVIGLGTMGQFIVQALKLAGVKTLIVIDKNLNRLEVAKKFNPDVALKKILIPKIKGATKRYGADFVFECTGSPAVINASSSLIRKGGSLIQVGISDVPFEFNYLPFIWNQNRIQGIYAWHERDFEFAIDLIARKAVDPEPIVTSIISIDDIVEKGFIEAIKPDTKEIKILVDPHK
jgi:(R,R)-butanediol dehydrogenase/meso-butanediol dehydrogenase/diacetyl reductase